MIVEFSQMIIPGLVGAAAGFITSKYNWRIEKERDQFTRRRELVDAWRKDLLEDWDQTIGGSAGVKWAFMNKPAYWTLRVYLREEFRTELESDAIQIQLGRYKSYPRAQLSEEIARIEREWGLV